MSATALSEAEVESSSFFELEVLPHSLNRNEAIDRIPRVLERTTPKGLAMLVKPRTRIFFGDLDFAETRAHRGAHILLPLFGKLLTN
ncbi:MAG: hypothetical protein KUG77_23595, partial [Nannocystaceae bacterium]|nr:hypothetical protein [Nannocystaceae bacterium]